MTLESLTRDSSAAGDVETAIDDGAPPPSPAHKDIGHVTDIVGKRDPPDRTLLQSNEQKILIRIKQEVGSRQVSLGSLGFALNWIIDKAIKLELQNNWNDAYTVLSPASVPNNANVLS